MEIVGPIPHSSLRGKKYFIPLYDDASSLSLIRFLQYKSEASKAIKEMIIELGNAFGHEVQVISVHVKRLRTDNAKEFLSREFKAWLKEKGIRHELSAPYSPESNGKAERLNRTLLDMARTMLIDAEHLPNHRRLWAEAVNNANFLRNRMFTTAASDPDKTPYELIMGKKPSLAHVRRLAPRPSYTSRSKRGKIN